MIVFLHKRLEHYLHKVFAHTDAVVLTRYIYNNRIGNFFVKLGFADGNLYIASVFAVFYGIAYDIHQDTLDVQRASYQSVVKVFAMLKGKCDALSLKALPVKDGNLVKHLVQVEGNMLKVCFAGFELAHIQYIVYKFKQIA